MPAINILLSIGFVPAARYILILAVLIFSCFFIEKKSLTLLGKNFLIGAVVCFAIDIYAADYLPIYPGVFLLVAGLLFSIFAAFKKPLKEDSSTQNEA